jgi:hypothetical protein
MAKSKVRSERIHAKRRALERYGVAFSNDDLQDIVRKIQAGKATLVGRQSNRVTVWIVEHADMRLMIAYDKSRSSIVTFLPVEGEPGGATPHQ